MSQEKQQEELTDFLNGLTGRMTTSGDVRTFRKFFEDPELRQRVRRNILLLKALRNLSGQRLAEEADIHPSQLSRLENARFGTSLATLSGIAEALGISFPKLILLDLARVLSEHIE